MSHIKWLIFKIHILFKGSCDPIHFIFEINEGPDPTCNDCEIQWRNFRSTQNWLEMNSSEFWLVLCRIRLFPTLISKIRWLESGLPLKLLHQHNCELEKDYWISQNWRIIQTLQKFVSLLDIDLILMKKNEWVVGVNINGQIVFW